MTLNATYTLPGRRSLPERVARTIWGERLMFIVTFSVLLGGSAVLISRIPPTFSSSARVLIESSNPTEQLISPGATTVGDPLALGNRVDPINNQISVITSTPLYQEALRKAGMTLAEAPIELLSAQVVPGTDVIEISYRAATPTLAQMIVSAVVAVYKEKNLFSNRERATIARQYLEKSLPQLQKTLKQAQDRLQQFQDRHGFLGTPTESEGITADVRLMGDRVNQAQAELAFTQQKIRTLQSQLPGDMTAALRDAGLNKDPNYQALQSQLLIAETDLVSLQSRYTNDSSQVRSALEKRDRLKGLVRQVATRMTGSPRNLTLDPVRRGLVEQSFALESERNAQSARLTALSIQLRQLQSRSGQLPQLIKDYGRLKGDVDQAQQNYLLVSGRYTASLIVEKQSLGNVRIIEPARFMIYPIAPRRRVLLALAFVLSTAAALAWVWLRRISSNKLVDTYDLVQILDLPILALLPKQGHNRLAQLPAEPDSQLLYSYQLLQAHLRMLPRSIKIIGICSWTGTEGGSLVAENLALLEAQLGQRVLLIDTRDASVQRPKLRHYFSKASAKPTTSTDWIEETPSDGTKITPEPESSILDLEDFDILTYGVATSLNYYRKWSQLLERVSERYDLIIIDCPPVGGDPSATMLAALSDGIIWVTAPDQLGRRNTEAAAATLRTWQTRLLGQVVVGEAMVHPPGGALAAPQRGADMALPPEPAGVRS